MSGSSGYDVATLEVALAVPLQWRMNLANFGADFELGYETYFAMFLR